MSKPLVCNLKLARLLTFDGGRVRLVPGENTISEDGFLKVWKSDPTVRSYWENGSFTFTKGGKPWEPPAAPPAAAEPPPSLAGPPVDADSRSDRNPPPEPAMSSADADPVDAPAQVGGGVPGNVDEARELIAETSDVDVLEGWRERDKRVMVTRAIDDRLAFLDADDGDD